MNKELIQLVNIIQYRLEKSMRGADEKYYDFKLENASRSPNEILSHLVDVVNYAFYILDIPKPSSQESNVLPKVLKKFRLLNTLFSKEEIDDDTSKKLIYGPLSDTLTHIGQLAYLRRLQGNPIEHENFTKANI